MALLSTLTSGISALRSFTTGLDTIGNDIANVDTTAYKSSDTSFADTFNGVGVQVNGVNSNFTQGALTSTGNPTDLGISGNGYFMVQDPATQAQFATRDGQFHFDTTGVLVNQQGYQVLGGAPSTVGPITLGTPPSGATLQSVSIGTSGNVVETYSDGSQATTNHILMQSFTDQAALVSQGGNLYSNLAAAGPGSTSLAIATNTPGTGSLGTLESGTLEQSNVDLTQQFANMITMQRAFEANARLVTVSDTILQDIIALKPA